MKRVSVPVHGIFASSSTRTSPHLVLRIKIAIDNTGWALAIIRFTGFSQVISRIISRRSCTSSSQVSRSTNNGRQPRTDASTTDPRRRRRLRAAHPTIGKATALCRLDDSTQPRPTVSCGYGGEQQRWRRRCNGHTLQTSGQWSSVRHGLSWGGGGRGTGSGALRPTAW